jgi:hypothetical protein
METTFTIVGLGIILGLTSLLKGLGLPTKYAPTASLIIGLCLVYLTEGVSATNTVLGLIAGLSASGLYSGTKATFTK